MISYTPYDLWGEVMGVVFISHKYQGLYTKIEVHILVTIMSAFTKKNCQNKVVKSIT